VLKTFSNSPILESNKLFKKIIKTKIEPLVMQKLIDGRLVSGGRDVRAETEDAALHLRVGMIQAAGQLSVVPENIT
jgi:hypothetical protein